MLLKVDPLSVGDHYHLLATDNCYFIREYTAEGFDSSPDNSIVFNFKCPMNPSNKRRLYYKRQAIQVASTEIKESLAALNTLADTVFIPLPPSKLPSSPEYDSRVRDVLRLSEGMLGIRVVEALSAQTERVAAHGAANRPTIEKLAANFAVNSIEWIGAKYIVIFDDVLVTGAQFKAAERVLRTYDPNANILGLFWVRRTFP